MSEAISKLKEDIEKIKVDLRNPNISTKERGIKSSDLRWMIKKLIGHQQPYGSYRKRDF